jgi:hypothetical protein
MGGWILGGGAPGRRGRGAPGIGIEDDDTDSDSNLAKGIYVLLFDFHLVGTFPKRLIFLDGGSTKYLLCADSSLPDASYSQSFSMYPPCLFSISLSCNVFLTTGV